MIRELAKFVAYTQAPKTTYRVLHPVRTLQMKKVGWDMKHAYAPRLAAVGGFLLALPVGMVIGRLTAGERVHEPETVTELALSLGMAPEPEMRGASPAKRSGGKRAAGRTPAAGANGAKRASTRKPSGSRTRAAARA